MQYAQRGRELSAISYAAAAAAVVVIIIIFYKFIFCNLFLSCGIITIVMACVLRVQSESNNSSRQDTRRDVHPMGMMCYIETRLLCLRNTRSSYNLFVLHIIILYIIFCSCFMFSLSIISSLPLFILSCLYERRIPSSLYTYMHNILNIRYSERMCE